MEMNDFHLSHFASRQRIQIHLVTNISPATMCAQAADAPDFVPNKSARPCNAVAEFKESMNN